MEWRRCQVVDVSAGDPAVTEHRDAARLAGRLARQDVVPMDTGDNAVNAKLSPELRRDISACEKPLSDESLRHDSWML